MYLYIFKGQFVWVVFLIALVTKCIALRSNDAPFHDKWFYTKIDTFMPTSLSFFAFLRQAVIITSCVLTIPLTAFAAVDCSADIDLSDDVVWKPVKRGVDKLHFLASTSPDRPNCPGGDGCELDAFLVSGDQVIVTTSAYEPIHKKSLICGVYVSNKGKVTYGWLDNRGFFGGGNGTKSIEDPKVMGTWRSIGGNEITIAPGEQGVYLRVEGWVSEGLFGAYREGYISGPAFLGQGRGGEVAGYSASHYDGSSPAGAEHVSDDYVCRARFRFTGYYLLVDDNFKCGNHPTVSFTGVYVKK